jgi:alkanesulfonate monooxygenase SsuD/methylene tetrahydromethanopterin reductase-like flavin-dependent oxidoreductase (luciferase family)
MQARRMNKRTEVYRKVLPDIERVVKAHGFDNARFAINRWLTVTRTQLAIRRKQDELRRELSDLEKKIK